LLKKLVTIAVIKFHNPMYELDCETEASSARESLLDLRSALLPFRTRLNSCESLNYGPALFQSYRRGGNKEENVTTNVWFFGSTKIRAQRNMGPRNPWKVDSASCIAFPPLKSSPFLSHHSFPTFAPPSLSSPIEWESGLTNSVNFIEIRVDSVPIKFQN
jgi:hypothetical protein